MRERGRAVLSLGAPPGRARACARRRGRRILAAGLLAVVSGLGCGGDDCDVVAYTSVDQVFSDPVFRELEAETGMRVCAVFDTEEAAERDRDRRNRLSTKTTHKAQAV